MNEGKELREAVDSVSPEMLDHAISLAFKADSDDGTRAEDESSRVIGRYKLLEQIGEGGFGVVYMAEQQEPIRRRVALKIIKLGMDTRQVIARFEAERQALALMDHENIAGVLDAGATDSGRPYFVMELVRGVPITEYCDRNRLSTHDRLKLFVSVCRAVRHAHQKGIIHRDLKPNNVLVTLRDGVPVPKVIDFGVAKATQQQLTEKTVFTRYGQFVGTPAYMSPEQVEMSELDVDTRSDIYSLGVLLYELLTGSTPVEQEQLRQAGYAEMQRMICEQEPPRPSTRLSQSGEALATISAQRSTEPKKLGQIMRGDLDWIVMKTLEKDRTRRYETANDLSADILHYLNSEPVLAGPPSASYRFRKFVRRNSRPLAVVAAFILLMLCGTVISTWQAVRAYRAEQVAEEERDDATELSDDLLAEQRRAAAAERQRQIDRVAALLTTTADSVPVLIDEMRSSRENVLPLIRDRHEDAQRFEDRLRLAIARTLLDDPQLEFLAESVADAPIGECANLLMAFRSRRQQSVPLLQQQFAAGDNEPSRFRLAVLLLDLGEAEAAADLLSWGPDPSRRSGFISGFREWHGDLAAVADALRGSPRPALQSGLALAAGGLDPSDVTDAVRDEIVAALSELYLNADDPAVHSASDWALRRWNATPLPVPAEPPVPPRRWYVGAAGQTMVVLGHDSGWQAAEPDSFPGTYQFPYAFAIADRETTVALFRQFLDDPDYPEDARPTDWPGVDTQLSPSDDCPVHHLSVRDVMMFCNWLSHLEGRQPCYEADDAGDWWCNYDCNGYRLPDVDEWDFACYAGVTTRFPFGNDEFLLLEYGNLLLRRSQPGALLMPNDHGLFDMLGNVWDLSHAVGVPEITLEPRQQSARSMILLRGATFGTGSYYVEPHVLAGSGKERSSDEGFRVACRIIAPGEDGRLPPQVAVTWLDHQIAAKPEDSNLRRQHASMCARIGRWRDAADDYRALVRVEPDSSHHRLYAAELLVRLGETDEYREHCRQMLEQLGETDEPLVANRICKACLLLPNAAVAEPAVVMRLAQTADSPRAPAWAVPYMRATHGLAEYRAGRFEEAMELLEQNRHVITTQPFLLEFNLAVLALACQAAGQHADAREYLEEASAGVAATREDPHAEGWRYWHDWLLADILCREAAMLIEAE